APANQLPLLAPGLADACAQNAPAAEATVELHHAEPGRDQYAHHACIAHADGRFFAAWSGGACNEDSPGQVVRFALSRDGAAWEAVRTVNHPAAPHARWTAGGFWQHPAGLRLLAVRYSSARYVDGEREPGVCWTDLATEQFAWNGSSFEPLGVLLEDFYANEAPRRLPGGGWMTTGVNGRHDALVAIRGEAETSAWRVITLSKRAEDAKLTEPSWYACADGTIRVLLRDDGGSRRLFLCESSDGGASFTPPRATDFTDAQSKFFALALPSGRIAVVGNPSPHDLRRRMLAVALSDGGRSFARMRLVRLDAKAAARSPGMHKAAGFQYPNACAAKGRLWVIYSVNKEDVALSSLPLEALEG
ncbi:MAG: exo-alpha-sialidase, partial [Planctomycetota bacterium]|nr:exo-alpha-sialidase [Planctomycetota bacterium]